MRQFVLSSLLIGATALLAGTANVAKSGEVTIYTGTVQWIGKAQADAQAAICVDMLNKAGIKTNYLKSDADMKAVADWVSQTTGYKDFDVLVLYGDLPPTIYPDKNAQPDGSIAEKFIESTDGDAIINHADYMFWGLAGRNEEGGLKNMMDIPNITMWDDNTPLTVTNDGKKISPTLATIGNLSTDRPFHLDELAGDWKVEVSLAQNAAGTRADPVIVRDGNKGRLIPVIQTNSGGEPQGAIAAEIITWLVSQIPTTAVKPKDKLSVTWAGLKQ
jgi:hypothetical protein